MQEVVKTYNSKIKNLYGTTKEILKSLCEHNSVVKHHLLQDKYHKELNVNDLKKDYQKRYGINARHYNSISYSLLGLVNNWRENLQNVIKTYKRKVEGTTKSIKSFQKKLNAKDKGNRENKDNKKESKNSKLSKSKIKFIIHHKKRKLTIFKFKLEKAKQDLKNNRPKICFGGKKLFKAQHNLKVNGYKSHEEWKSDFDLRRKKEVFFIGSSDRTLGNGNCHFIRLDDAGVVGKGKRNSLKITLPKYIIDKYKLKTKYLYLKNVTCRDDKRLKKIRRGELPFDKFRENYLCNPQSKKAQGPATYRIHFTDNDTVKIGISLRFVPPELLTRRDIGSIGVDQNNGFISVAEVDRFGNIVKAYDLQMNVNGKSKKQSSEIIRLVAQKVVNRATELKVPIIYEDLDFSKKKCEELGKRFNRILSSFPSRKFRATLKSISVKKGVEIKGINPAFTSIIGFAKFCRGYGISSHQGAAHAIARRGMYFSEKLSTRTARPIPDEFAADLQLAKEKDADRHVWKHWGNFATCSIKHKLVFYGVDPPSEKA